MGKKLSTRIVVKYENKYLRLFSIIERDCNDLVIKPRQGEFIRNVKTNYVDKNATIINQKYSIHCSPKSQESINAIVQTIDLSNKETIKTRLYTKALKQNSLFIPVYITRSQNLDNPKYETDNDCKELIELGNYNPKKGVLYYSIIIGNKGTHIEFKNNDDFKTRTLQFREFSLTIIWSFSLGPSNEHGTKRNLITVPPEELPEIEQILIKGIDNNNVIQSFKSWRNDLHEEHLKLVINKYPELKNDMFYIKSLGFYSNIDFL